MFKFVVTQMSGETMVDVAGFNSAVVLRRFIRENYQNNEKELIEVWYHDEKLNGGVFLMGNGKEVAEMTIDKFCHLMENGEAEAYAQ